MEMSLDEAYQNVNLQVSYVERQRLGKKKVLKSITAIICPLSVRQTPLSRTPL